MLATRRIAVILGAGPGTGASLARALSPTHSLLLLSPSLPSSLPRLNLSLPDADLLAVFSNGSKSSLEDAFKQMRDKWPDGVVDVGICNMGNGGDFAPGGFLEQKADDMRNGLEHGFMGPWTFSSLLLPLFLQNTSDIKGTYIFTGATMSVRGSANFSAMAPIGFARRALAQSLAREFGPKGIHVAHVVVDGVIATPRTEGKAWAKDVEMLSTDGIASTYLALINQPRSAWTHEMDIRPSAEKW